jgi:hypothetical protein
MYLTLHEWPYLQRSHTKHMKTATIQEIKEAIGRLPASRVNELCLRLARFKQENKELLSYMLFSSDDPDGYVEEVKAMMREEFREVNKSQLYFAKKSLRRILRIVNKQVRYIGTKTAEIELLLAYCEYLRSSGIPIKKSPALEKIYEGQLKKVRKILPALHEDLQHDYERALKKLSD